MSENSGAGSPAVNAGTLGALAGADPPRSEAGDPHDAAAIEAAMQAPMEMHTHRDQPLCIGTKDTMLAIIADILLPL